MVVGLAMFFRRILTSPMFCLLAIAPVMADLKPAPSPTEAKPAATDYVRWVDTETEEGLQTASVRFTRGDGAIVDLVGAVHIADKAYFEDLNRRFRTYDAVLYELVGGPMPKTEADKASRAKARETSNLSWLSQLHQTMQRSLALSSQLEEVDYSGANFVHADVTLEQFDKLKTQKQESFLGLMLKAYAVQAQMEEEGKMAKQPNLAQLMAILLQSDSANNLKRVIGEQFDLVEDLITGIEGGDGTVIIGERNKVALEVLKQQVAAGKKNLAVFYGAAHLPDMEKRLSEQGWKKVKAEWLTAWDLVEQ
jgi:hypothetical protein